MGMFDNTARCKAHFYLDDGGQEVTRDEFLENNKEWHGVMLYVGSGFVPLVVAVATLDARGYHGIDYGSAVETFEEWCRKTGREDEIEDGWMEEMQMQAIPAEVMALE